MPRRSISAETKRPLLPSPEVAKLLALSSDCLNFSTVLKSGFGAPLRTATPTPIWPSTVRDEASTLPSLISPATSIESTMTSYGSPALTLATSSSGSADTVTALCPVARSNCGRRMSQAPRAAPVRNTLISAACAGL